MLKLKAISIRGLRSLHDVPSQPIQPGMTVVTGENDGGKTTFLQAVAFLLGAGKPDKADHSVWSPDEDIVVEGVFSQVGADAAEDVRIRRRRTAGGQELYETPARIHPLVGAPVGGIKLSKLREKLDALGIPSPGGTARQPYEDALKKWLAAQPPTSFVDNWVPLEPEQQNRLPAVTQFSSAAAPSAQNEILQQVRREAQRLLAGTDYSEALSSLDTRLEADITPALERIRTIVSKYCPDLESIDVVPKFDFRKPACTVSVAVTKEGKIFDFAKSGDGRQRRVTLAIHEANLDSLAGAQPRPAEVLLYDEPDTHFDYASQRKLFSLLSEQASLEHVQVIVATHSLNFIDRVSMRSVLHLRQNQDLRTGVERLLQDDLESEWDFLASVCSGLGLRNSVLLDEGCFLAVEGETEEAAIPGLFQRITGVSLAAAGVCLLNTQGSGALRRMVEVLVTRWKRRVVVLLDEDQRHPLKKWTSDLGLTEGDNLFYVGAPKEFEDAFSNDTWTEVLNAHYRPQDGVLFTAQEIQGQRAEEKFSEALRVLACSRFKGRVTKPDLGLALGSALTDLDNVPSALKECLVAARDAADRA